MRFILQTNEIQTISSKRVSSGSISFVDWLTVGVLPLVPFCRCDDSSVGDRLATAGLAGCCRPVARGNCDSECGFCKTLDAFRCASALDLIAG